VLGGITLSIPRFIERLDRILELALTTQRNSLDVHFTGCFARARQSGEILSFRVDFVDALSRAR